MFRLGVFAVALGATFFGAREIERKLQQRREDPVSYAETPLAWTGGAAIGLLTYAIVKAAGGTKSLE